MPGSFATIDCSRFSHEPVSTSAETRFQNRKSGVIQPSRLRHRIPNPDHRGRGDTYRTGKRSLPRLRIRAGPETRVTLGSVACPQFALFFPPNP